MNRRVVQVERGVLRIEQDVSISQRALGTDVSGPACVCSHVHVTRGMVRYLHGQTEVVAPSSFTLIVPPFAVVQASLERCRVTSTAVAFRPLAPDGLPTEPVMMTAEPGRPPRSWEDVLDLWHAGAETTPVGRATHPSPPAWRAKSAIDAAYGGPLAIGLIARRLRMSPSAVSRAFSKAYGLPPVRYRHRVRVMDALMRFAAGEAPAEVFQDVGFDDLSRFYKIFRRVTCGAPGTFRPARAKNAKT